MVNNLSPAFCSAFPKVYTRVLKIDPWNIIQGEEENGKKSKNLKQTIN